ncbi:hypothetical protein L1987_37936 [Smallanthus sonchifolius]|uniref:Uncharacterized protein n=1 Tax=Smallanthus sonchifolius TaxID=185202 RepID=A0ACB9HHT4_9ASTR|nr:hypothetical protein L1987_37936 [Smallanthus sonchifolius]
MPSLAYESLSSHSAFVSSLKLLTTRSKLLLVTHLRNLTEIPISDFPSQGGLIVSDYLNHNSIVNGARGSGATIRMVDSMKKVAKVDIELTVEERKLILVGYKNVMETEKGIFDEILKRRDSF